MEGERIGIRKYDDDIFGVKSKKDAGFYVKRDVDKEKTA